MNKNNTLLFAYVIPVLFIVPLTAYLLKALNLYYNVSIWYLLFLIIETAVFVPFLYYLNIRSTMFYKLRVFIVIGLVNFGFCLLFSHMNHFLNIILIIPGIVLSMISADMVQMIFLNDQCLKLIDENRNNPAEVIRKHTQFMSENNIRISKTSDYIYYYSIVRFIIILPLMLFKIYPGMILSFFLLIAASVEFLGIGILRNYLHERLFHNNNLINNYKLIFQQKTMSLIILCTSFLAAMVLGQRFSLLHSGLLIQFWTWFISLFNNNERPLSIDFQQNMSSDLPPEGFDKTMFDQLNIEPLFDINWELVNKIGLYLLIAIILIFILYPLSNKNLYRKITEKQFLKTILKRIRTFLREITSLFKNAFYMFIAIFGTNRTPEVETTKYFYHKLLKDQRNPAKKRQMTYFIKNFSKLVHWGKKEQDVQFYQNLTPSEYIHLLIMKQPLMEEELKVICRIFEEALFSQKILDKELVKNWTTSINTIINEVKHIE